jgi:esterase/lipase superfamily enzyme/tetratricopeptide (TPR) repeat protein
MLSRPLLAGETEAAISAVAAVESYLQSGEVPTEASAAAEFFAHVSLTAFKDVLTQEETQQLRAARVFSLPVPQPVLAAAGEAASVNEPGRAIERLRGLGLIDLHLPTGEREEVAVNPLARPLVPALSEAETIQIAEKAIAPLYSSWKNADGGLPADPRGLAVAQLALLGQAPADIVNASARAGAVFLFRTLHEAQPALELVLLALAALDRVKAAPDLHLLRHGADCAERLGRSDDQERLLELGMRIEDGDPRARAMLLSASASRLIQTGGIDTAEKLLKEAVAVFETLGDVRARAVTMGKIADILQARGQLDEALKIRNEEELPVYERLGDVRELLIARAKLAMALLRRGRETDRGEASRLLGLAVDEARRLQLPEAQQIELLMAQAEQGIFSPEKTGDQLPDAVAFPPTEPVRPAPPPPPDSPTRGISGAMGEPTAAPHPHVQADIAEYVVWYGTNRRPNDPGDAGKGYSARRDTVVHYGSCRVFIPKSHKIGSIGSPWLKRLLTMTDDRLRLLGIEESRQEAYWSGIAARLAAIDAGERCALVFVHGYNVLFQDAALRAAQIGFDLSVKGAMAFFSWPSQGSTSGYPADEATIEASEGVIADFMTDFAEKSGAAAVHIIAHSMGNRGVLRAVNRIAAKAQRRTGKPFGQVILAAADVDADVFRQLSAAYADVASRTTLYVSKRDLAVEASRWLHNFPRAGLMPPTLVLPGIDTINVTNADLTMLGHGYVAEARHVLTDMHALITHGAPPNERFGLREANNEEGERYWLIGA